MRIGEAIRKLDEGVLMRGAFYLLLSAAAIFLVVDIRDMTAMNAAFPASIRCTKTSPCCRRP